MANVVLVDSNFYIARHRAGIDPFLELVTANLWEPVTCGIVILEVLRGTRTDREYRDYRDTFDVMTCVPTTSQIWYSTADLLRKLARQGYTIPVQDALIAASALSIDAPVLTFDPHFKLIPKLTVLDSLP
jgi:predicted nucleic acid-binding protein